MDKFRVGDLVLHESHPRTHYRITSRYPRPNSANEHVYTIVLANPTDKAPLWINLVPEEHLRPGIVGEWDEERI